MPELGACLAGLGKRELGLGPEARRERLLLLRECVETLAVGLIPDDELQVLECVLDEGEICFEITQPVNR